MARVNVPVTAITRTGVAPAAEVTGDPVNNHSMTNTEGAFLLVRNSGATVSRTVTVNLSQLVDGQTPAAKTYSIPVSASRYIGPFPVVFYGSTVNVDVDNAELRLSAYAATS